MKWLLLSTSNYSVPRKLSFPRSAWERLSTAPAVRDARQSVSVFIPTLERGNDRGDVNNYTVLIKGTMDEYFDTASLPGKRMLKPAILPYLQLIGKRRLLFAAGRAGELRKLKLTISSPKVQ